MSIAKNILRERNYTLQLIKGKTLEGKSHYAYMLFNAKLFDGLSDAELAKNLNRYGYMVLQAEGDEPTPAQHAEALRQFNLMLK